MADKKEKGHGILSGLKSLVFEEDQTDSKGGEDGAPAPVAVPARTYAGNGSAIDPEVRKVLEGDIQAAAKPAYSEFITVSESMADVITDESQRFKATLKVLAGKGMDLKAVLFDIDECLQALDAKEKQAAEAESAAVTARVGAKEAQAAKIDSSIEEKKRQIAKLQQEIAGLEAEKASAAQEIKAERADIDSTHRRFAATVAAFRSELNQKRQTIERLGKGV